VNFRSWINSTVFGMNPLLGLARRIPWRVWIGAACLGLAWLWLHEHDARIRQNASLAQSRRETAAEVAGLKKQAAAAVEAANVENAQAIEKLKARRQNLERRDQELTSQLAALHQEEQAQAAQVATLPTSEVVTRVAAQLGLGAQDLAPAGGAAGAGSKPAPGTIPVAAICDRRSLIEKPTVGKAPTVATKAGGEDTAPTTPGSPEISVLPLSASGARKVETALVELEGCRARSLLEEQQISNCRERAATDAQTIARQADSLGKLNQALAAKDQILARQEAAYTAELRAARGTFWGRLGRVSKHVAIGVAVGVALGVAVR